MKADYIEFLIQNHISYEDGKPASDFTSFKIGGPCLAVYPDGYGKFISAVNGACERGVKYVVIGAGSNVIFPDEGYDGAVILTKYVNDEPAVYGEKIVASCGTPLFTLCKAALENSLTGLEFAYGIPGTVGGAVFMNAGAYGGEIKDLCTYVKAFSPSTGKIVEYGNEQCRFGYRESRFSNGSDEIILSAEFELSKGDKEVIKEEMARILQKRKDKQPLNYPSAGSVFKRYPGRYTGQMIEAAGLKGYSVGGAQVSEKHAGFIVNIGGATAEDVKRLIRYIKDVIMEKEQAELECEVRFID